MELMLDSANLNEIKKIKSLGLLGGLTTNPLIIKRGINEMNYSGDFYELAKKMLEYTNDKPCFLQVIGHTSKEMTDNAKRIYEKLSEYGNIHIKIPFNPSIDKNHDPFAGLETLVNLREESIPTLATAIVAPSQAYLASQAGADYAVLMLRPYDNLIAEEIGIELNETGFLDSIPVREILDKKDMEKNDYLSGLETLEASSKMFSTRNLDTKLIIAGIRNPIQFDKAVSEPGVSAVTLPYSVLLSILPHEGTKRFVEQTYSESPKIYQNFMKNE